MTAFGTVDAIKAAHEDDLLKVVNLKVAQAIRTWANESKGEKRLQPWIQRRVSPAVGSPVIRTSPPDGRRTTGPRWIPRAHPPRHQRWPQEVEQGPCAIADTADG